MSADQSEIHRERGRDCVEKEEDGQFLWGEWEWESTVGEVGSARGAFEPRGGRLSGGRMTGRMKAAGYKVAKDKMAVTGGSTRTRGRTKVKNDKNGMTGVEELELKELELK